MDNIPKIQFRSRCSTRLVLRHKEYMHVYTRGQETMASERFFFQILVRYRSRKINSWPLSIFISFAEPELKKLILYSPEF